MRGLIARALDRLETLRARWIAESPPQLPERLTPLKPPAVEMIPVPRFELELWMGAMAEMRVTFGPPERYPPGSSTRAAMRNLHRTYTDIRDVLLLDSIRSSLDDPGEKRA